MADKVSSSLLNRFKRFFRMGVTPSGELPSDKINLYNIVKDEDKSGKPFYKVEKEKFNSEIEQLFNYWMDSCHDSIESWKDRLSMFDDMDTLYFNCAPIAKSMEIIIDEVLQADSNNQFIFIEAKTKVKKYIEQFFDEINLNSLLRPTVSDIVQYGNAGWALGFDNIGVNKVKLVNPRHIKERLEFSPIEIYDSLYNEKHILTSYRQSIDLVDNLVNMILDKNDISSYFDEYLLGFVIEDTVLPPWKFIHFRNTTNKSPFKPFGIPLYIHAMAPYRQYDAAMALQVSARGAMFPKSLYKIKLPNITSPTQKFEKASEFLNELLNSGFGQSKKELPGIGDIIVTIDDLFDYEQISADIDLGKVDDIEMLKDDIYDATLLPRRLIDPKDSGFGESGVAYLEQFKPFARLIYRFQSILLANITELVKIHLIHTQEFSLDEIEFSLSMPYPESQTNREIIDSQEALLELANDVIGAIEDKITGGERLPVELVKTIYHKFLPYDSGSIDNWIDSAEKAKENGETLPPEDDFGFQFEAAEKWGTLEKTLKKSKLKEMVDDIVFEETYKKLREGTINNKHFYTSKNKMVEFDISILNEIKQSNIKKLEEKSRQNELDVKFKNLPHNMKEYKLEIDGGK
jgi:hypothetical protein